MNFVKGQIILDDLLNAADLLVGIPHQPLCLCI